MDRRIGATSERSKETGGAGVVEENARVSCSVDVNGGRAEYGVSDGIRKTRGGVEEASEGSLGIEEEASFGLGDGEAKKRAAGWRCKKGKRC